MLTTVRNWSIAVPPCSTMLCTSTGSGQSLEWKKQGPSSGIAWRKEKVLFIYNIICVTCIAVFTPEGTLQYFSPSVFHILRTTV